MEYEYIQKKVIEHLEKQYSDLIIKRDLSHNFTLYEKDEKKCIDEQGCHLYESESFELFWEKRCDTKLYKCDVEEEVKSPIWRISLLCTGKRFDEYELFTYKAYALVDEQNEIHFFREEENSIFTRMHEKVEDRDDIIGIWPDSKCIPSLSAFIIDEGPQYGKYDIAAGTDYEGFVNRWKSIPFSSYKCNLYVYTYKDDTTHVFELDGNYAGKIGNEIFTFNKHSINKYQIQLDKNNYVSLKKEEYYKNENITFGNVKYIDESSGIKKDDERIEVEAKPGKFSFVVNFTEGLPWPVSTNMFLIQEYKDDKQKLLLVKNNTSQITEGFDKLEYLGYHTSEEDRHVIDGRAFSFEENGATGDVIIYGDWDKDGIKKKTLSLTD